MSQDLFGDPIPEEFRSIKNKTPKMNPMIPVYGQKDGHRCKDCLHLLRRDFSKTYYKCALRKITCSPATDHRKHWPACGKFEMDLTPNSK